MNTSLSATTRKTPYAAVFGQEPRSNCSVLEILQEQGVLDEDTLPQNLIETEDDTQSNDAEQAACEEQELSLPPIDDSEATPTEVSMPLK